MNKHYQMLRQRIQNELCLIQYSDPTQKEEPIPAIFWAQSKHFAGDLPVIAHYDRQAAQIKLEIDGLPVGAIDVLTFADNENGNVYRLPGSNLVSFHLRDVIEVALLQFLAKTMEAAARLSQASNRFSQDAWAEDPAYPRSEWQQAVSSGETQLGYPEWVEHQIEAGD